MKSTLLVGALALGFAVSAFAATSPDDTVQAARLSAALNARVATPAGFTPIRPQQNVSTPTTSTTGAAGQMSQVLNKAASTAHATK